MMIKPSTCLRNDYNSISAFCKDKGEPVFLTKNGEGDLAVMSIEAYERREQMFDLREKLMEAEAERSNGAKTYSREEIDAMMENIINNG